MENLFSGYWRDVLQSRPNHFEMAVEKNTTASVLRPIASKYTIPMTSGRGYASLPPRHDMVARWRDSGKEWRRRAGIEWSEVETWAEFMAGWDRIRHPVGDDVVRRAWIAAQAAEEVRELAGGGDARLTLLARFCRELAREPLPEAFFPSSPTVARLLGIDPPVAWRLLRGLCALGLLEIVERGARQRAHRYRWIGK